MPWKRSTSSVAVRKYSEIFGQAYVATICPRVSHSTQAAGAGANKLTRGMWTRIESAVLVGSE